jgi:hypothetical protein
MKKHVVVVGSVRDKGVHFEEGAFVKKQADSVSRSASAA